MSGDTASAIGALIFVLLLSFVFPAAAAGMLIIGVVIFFVNRS